MVTMGNAMFIPTAIMSASPGMITGGNPQAASGPQNQMSSQAATMGQMALMTNNMALTGSMLTQFSSTLQTMLQGLSAGGQQCCPPVRCETQPQPPIYNYPQMPPTGGPQQPTGGNLLPGYCYPQTPQGVTQPPQQQPVICPPPIYNYPPQQQPAPYSPPAYVIPPYTMAPPNTPPTPAPAPAPPPAYNGGNGGRYWGDPHLEGFDGEKYDVMGKGGNIYNMLSDKGVQYNTKFIDWGKPGADGVQPTVIGEAGIQVGDNLVYFDVTGKAPTVNGKPLSKGQTVQLGNGQTASWDGEKLNVKTSEYTINLTAKEKEKHGGYLDSTVTINEGVNPLADGVAAHGLLGQTADGLAGQRKGVDGNKNIEKQGGSVIDGVVDDYKVTDLWDNQFKYNRFAPEEQDSLSQLLTLLKGLIAKLAAQPQHASS